MENDKLDRTTASWWYDLIENSDIVSTKTIYDSLGRPEPDLDPEDISDFFAAIAAKVREEINSPKAPEPVKLLEIVEPTGSRECSTDFRANSDVDFMAYTSEQDEIKITAYMNTQGFYFSKSWMNGSSLSYKDNSTPQKNVIVIRDRLTFERWRCATRACKYLNIRDKNARREMFHRIVHNEPLPEEMKVHGNGGS